MRRKPPYVWIVEGDFRDGWKPTVGCALDRANGRDELRKWQRKSPDDRFRLRRYVAEQPPRSEP